jgi:hypothetical protein
LIQVHGSSEGIVRADDESAGVLLVTTGKTLRDNDLDFSVPLLATDVCAITTDDSEGRFTDLGLDELPVLSMPSFTAHDRP